jgi:Rieske Fe-S protein
MARLLGALNRRSLLKLALTLPLARLFDGYLSRFFGFNRGTATAATVLNLKVARVSELKQPWDSARFSYRIKDRAIDVYDKEAVIDQLIPGVVIRLPDELAEKRGGGIKAKFAVLDLHCTHERCISAYITDKSEIRAMADLTPKNPVVYCPCHRSVFDITDGGKAIKGPAKAPLWKFDFDVKGDDIIVTGLEPKASKWEPGRPGALGAEYPVRAGEPGL